MRVLVDENVPKGIKKYLSEHLAKTVPERGWASKKNGELLSLADGEFDVLLTMDKSIPKQQNLSGRSIALLTMRAKSNKLEDLIALVPKLQEVLGTIQPGQVVRVSADTIEIA
jgi:predicted nuclease of predicted toxin-antitoxin system